MDPLAWGLIGTLVGTIVGAAASVITTVINARSSSKNQIDIETFKRRQLFRDFQKDNCLIIQNLIGDIMNIADIIHTENIAYSDKPVSGNGWRNKENYANIMEVLTNLTIYLERIQQNQLREDLNEFRSKIARLILN